MSTPETTEIALVDLSAISYPIFMMSGAQPDPDYTSTSIVARVRSLTAQHPRAAVCCDKGKSFRHALAPSYKAQREAAPAALHHQIALAKERLAADGYPVWTAPGFEADDVIATATTIALGLADTTVLIMSADKDLFQLVGPRVRVLSVTHGTIYDAAGVVAKFGVQPSQVRDYLMLVGDASDNVKGAAGIGPKKAAELLTAYGTLDAVYFALERTPTQFKPAIATSLREFKTRVGEVSTLITLRTDAAIPFFELDNNRAPADAAPMEDTMQDVRDTPALAPSAPTAVTGTVVEEPAKPAPVSTADTKPAVATMPADALAAAPVEFERQLEPRSLGQAMQLANHMHTARMFNGYGSAQAVLSTILAGRELGLQAIASLRCMHIVEGKHCPSADLLRALVLRSGKAKYFRCTERTDTAATFETQRGDDPPMTLRYTIADAEAAGLVKDKGGYKKNPADMLVARASSKLARLVYPDVCAGLYAPDEFAA